ncbi:MAG: hypothetical protein C0593_01060 [Marinilabiliales bacterium]|nr:MAG: hypothetical protein C0593_01060 [Marinilabiliales bacterium]
MKKQIFLITGLILGVSGETLAGTGGAKDGFMFFAVVIGFLLFVWGLLAGGSFLKNNGRKTITKTTHAIKGFFNSVIDKIRKAKSLLKHNPFGIKNRLWFS